MNNAAANGFTVRSSVGLQLGVWTRVTATLAGIKGTIYLNAVQQGQNANMMSPVSVSRATSWIGYNIDAALDSFRIYNSALSLAQIQALGNISQVYI